MSSPAGRGSEGRVAGPFVGRMQKTLGVRVLGRLGGVGECCRRLWWIDQPLMGRTTSAVTYGRESCACPGSGSWAGGPAGESWLRSWWVDGVNVNVNVECSGLGGGSRVFTGNRLEQLAQCSEKQEREE
jgi:hypothetical protein